MAKKTLTFAEKAARVKEKQEWKYVKYVKSIRSEKTGHWRFNETMVGLKGGETLDAALQRAEEKRIAVDIEIPILEEPVKEEVPSEIDNSEEMIAESVEPVPETASEVESVSDEEK